MPQDSPNATASPSRLTFAIICLTSALSTIATIWALYFFTNIFVGLTEFSGGNCYELTNERVCFFENALDSQSMMSVLTSFYSNLIVILVSILTLIGVVTALGIRYSAKQHVEAELPDLTSEFFGSSHGSKLIDERIELNYGGLSKELEEVKGALRDHDEFIAGFSEKLVHFQYQLDSMDGGQYVYYDDDVEEEGEVNGK